MAKMTDSYNTVFSDFWRWRLAESPFYATLCADSSQKGRINSWTLEDREKSLAIGRQLTDRLLKLKDEDLNGDSFDIDMLLYELKTYVEGLESSSFFFPIGIFDNPASAVDRMFLTMILETREDLDAALSCAKAVPMAYEERIAVMRVGAEKGITFHRVILDLMLRQLKGHRDGPPDNFIWLHTLRRKLVNDDNNNDDENAKVSFSKGELDDFLQSVVEIVEEDVQPAISGLVNFLEDFYITKARPEISIASVPKQDNEKLDLYSHCLRFHIDLPMTPDEVHELGLKEVERIEKEIQVTIEEIGFDGDYEQFSQHLLSKPESFFASKEELNSFARNLIYDRVIPSLSKCFVDVPQFPFEIRPIVGRASAPMGYYNGGTPDKTSPGVFFISLEKFSTSPKCLWLSLILHESIPGHHLQDIYGLTTEGVPTYRRVMDGGHYIEVPARFPTHCAFGEGWALYAESLGKELGMYTDPLDYFGKLQYELLRAVRLIVDTGLHAFGWSQEKATLFFREKLKMFPAETAIGEVIRYMGYPAQCCSYKIGEVKIWELRGRAEEALGPQFDLREFHKAILTRGFVPLMALEGIVEEFIRQWKA